MGNRDSLGARIANHRLALAEVAVVGFVFLTVVLVYLSHGPVAITSFNSDNLQIPMLFRHVFQDGGSVSDWNPSRAGFFFPDWAMFLVPYLITRDVFFQQLLMSLLQLGLLYAILRAIHREVFPGSRPAVLLSLGGFALIALLALQPEGLSLPIAFPDSTNALNQVVWGSFHAGELVSGLACIWLYLWFWRRPSLVIAGAIATISFLTALSDWIYVPHFAVPLAVAVLFYDATRRSLQMERTAALVVAPLVATLAGTLLQDIVSPSDNPPSGIKLGLEYVEPNLRRSWHLLSEGAVVDGLPIAGAALVLFYAAAAVLVLLHLRSTSREHDPATFVAIVALMSAGAWVCSVAIARESVALRYWLPFFVLAIAFLPAVLWRLTGPRVAYGVSGGMLAISGLLFIPVAPDFDLHTDYYPEEVACLDRELAGRGYTVGFGTYWNAKYVSALSNEGLRVVSMTPVLTRDLWLNSSGWYEDGYDFVVNEPLGYELRLPLLFAINGAPDFTTVCGRLNVYAYDNRRLITAERPVHGFLPAEDADGSGWSFPAASLPRHQGVADGSSVVLTPEKNGPEGLATFGPFINLPAGSYTAVLEYQSPATPQVVVGAWTLEAQGLQTQALAGTIQGTSGQRSRVAIEVVIEEGTGGSRVALSTTFTGAADLTLHSLSFVRQDGGTK